MRVLNKAVLFSALLLFAGATATNAAAAANGMASWYGEAHRGRLMANGEKFNPDRFTAASWFYPLGARVRVTLNAPSKARSVIVTITDRGPAQRLVRDGRIIDLGYAAFSTLAPPQAGLIPVTVQMLK